MEPSDSSDKSTLQTVGLLYIIFGIIGCLVSLVPIIHILFFSQLLSAAGSPNAPPQAFKALMILIPAVMIIVGEIVSIAMIMCGVKLRELNSYTFIFVCAVISLFAMPVGTALGIVTLILIQKPQNKALFTPVM